ncbi:hypothetical protein RRSWK_05533 [Rhodopirellula sp. SWK7]|nr:hypothetical protein RRSWK_05533 [Rhodopirellula sp. SWK7]
MAMLGDWESVCGSRNGTVLGIRSGKGYKHDLFGQVSPSTTHRGSLEQIREL